MDKYQKLTNTLGNLKKIADFIQKNAKIRGIETLESNPLLLETIQCPIIKPSRRLIGPWSCKNSKKTKIFKPEKKCEFCQIAIICDIQNLKPVPWPLKNFQ